MRKFVFVFVLAMIVSPPLVFAKAFMGTKPPRSGYQEYQAYFERVFATFQDHYYLEPKRADFDAFMETFRTKIYAQLKSEGKSDDYVKWRSAWYLVERLKSAEDKFSQFYPPKPAEKFQKEALGQRVDVGLEGKKVDAGFEVTRVEPRSDAYEKGLREADVLTHVDGQALAVLPQDSIETLLTPLLGAHVEVTYHPQGQAVSQTVQIESKEYFKQTVFLREVAVPGVFCLEIPKFNRTSGEDLFRFLRLIEQYQPLGLVLDFRGNPGGPPLAAREMSAFFLNGGEEFVRFQKRGIPADILDVPTIDAQYKFNAPIAILVDHDSGSAAELFPGIMQFRKRAIVLGVNTAGQVLLKSMFPLPDGAMVALVTAPGYYPDGRQFSFQGITPDQIITDAPKDGLINLAAAILVSRRNR